MVIDPGLAAIIAALIIAFATLIAVRFRRGSVAGEETDEASDDENGESENIELINETKVVGEDSYEEYSHSFLEGDILHGKISADSSISVYVMNSRNFRSYKNDEEFTYIDGAENIKRLSLTSYISSNGKWYIVMENNDEDDKVEVDIDLSVTTSVE